MSQRDAGDLSETAGQQQVDEKSDTHEESLNKDDYPLALLANVALTPDTSVLFPNKEAEESDNSQRKTWAQSQDEPLTPMQQEVSVSSDSLTNKTAETGLKCDDGHPDLQRTGPEILLSSISSESDVKTEELPSNSAGRIVTSEVLLASTSVETTHKLCESNEFVKEELPLTEVFAPTSVTSSEFVKEELPLTEVFAPTSVTSSEFVKEELPLTEVFAPTSVTSSEFVKEELPLTEVFAPTSVTSSEFVKEELSLTEVFAPTPVTSSETSESIPHASHKINEFTPEGIPSDSVSAEVPTPASDESCVTSEKSPLDSCKNNEQIPSSSGESSANFKGLLPDSLQRSVVARQMCPTSEFNLVVSYSDSEDESTSTTNQVQTVGRDLNDPNKPSAAETDSEDSINVVDLVPANDDSMSQDSIVDSSPESLLPTESADTQDYEMIFQESSSKNIAFEVQASESDSSSDQLIINTDSDFIQTESQPETARSEASRETLPAEISRAVSESLTSESVVSDSQLDLTPSPYVDTPSAFSSRAETQDVSLDLTPSPYVDTPSAFSSKNETQDVFVNAASDGAHLHRGIKSSKGQPHLGQKFSAVELKSKIQILIEDAVSSEEEDEIIPETETLSDTNKGANKTVGKVSLNNPDLSAHKVETILTLKSLLKDVGLKTVENPSDVVVEASSEEVEGAEQQDACEVQAGSRSPLSDVEEHKSTNLTPKDIESSILLNIDYATSGNDRDTSTLMKNDDVKLTESLAEFSPPDCQISPEKSVILSELRSKTNCQTETSECFQETVELESNKSVKSPKDRSEKEIDSSIISQQLSSVKTSSLPYIETHSENISEISSNSVEQRQKCSNSESHILIGVLENLTEECAKEIFLESNKISENTSKVIAQFVEKVHVEKSAEMSSEYQAVDKLAEPMMTDRREPEYESVKSDRVQADPAWESLLRGDKKAQSPQPKIFKSRLDPTLSRYSAYDIDDERHPMEDVIDEFVVEINEDELLEQQQQQQQQEVEQKKSKRNKKAVTLQKAKKPKKETSEKKLRPKRGLDLSQQDDSKKFSSKVKKKKSLEVQETMTKRSFGRARDPENNSSDKGQAKRPKVAKRIENKTDTAEVQITKVAQEESEEEDISKIEEFIKSQVAIQVLVPEGVQLNVNKDNLNFEKSAETPPNGNEQKVVTEKRKRGRKRKQVPTTEHEKEVAVSTENAKEIETDVVSTQNEKEISVTNENPAQTVPPIKKGRNQSKKSKTLVKATEEVEQSPSECSSTAKVLQAPETAFVFKPVADWKKLLKMPTNFTQLSTKHLDQQVFQNPLQPYAPCVPRNTCKRLIDNLTDKDLEQLCCPGCKDRFLIPSTYFQHLYRKSVRITFICQPCGDVTLSFFNRCHLRTHVLSHLEVDGSSSVTLTDADCLSISPLEASQFNVGFFDDDYTEELDTLYREQSHSDSVQCTECRLTLDKNILASHFVDSTSAIFECSECHMNLPNKCSLAAHQRIHRKQSPLVCPECGQIFETWAFFRSHVVASCQHQARSLAISCRLCKSKNDEQKTSNCHYVSATNILGHIYESHVKIFYKCSFCSKAFVDKSRVYDHIQVCHSNEKDRQKVADFSLLFKAPFIKAPDNFFITRDGFEKRMWGILSKWPKKFLFKCQACSKYFETIDKLSKHSSQWCQQTDIQPQILSKLFTDTEVTNNSIDRRISERDRREEMIQHLAQLEALSSHCNDCTRLTIDFREHLTKHPTTAVTSLPTEKRSVTENEPTPIRVTRQLLESRGRPETVSRPNSVADARPGSARESLTINLEGSNSSTETATTERRTRTRGTLAETDPAKSGPVEAISTEDAEIQTQRVASTIQSHPMPEIIAEKEPAEKEGSVKNVSIVGEPSPPRKRGRPSLTSSPSTPRRSKVLDAKPFVEALGIDVLSNRKLLAFNRLDRQALAFGSTVKELSPPSTADGEETKLTCGLCRFTSYSREDFQKHILIHKPVVIKGVLTTTHPDDEMGPDREPFMPAQCLQCKECGMCFATEPSWKKHLFLLHRIKNPGAEHYCADLRHPDYSSSAIRLNLKVNKDSDDNDSRLVIDKTRHQHPCTVCRQRFANPLELRRHFRTHGMAFLKLQHSPPLPMTQLEHNTDNLDSS